MARILLAAAICSVTSGGHAQSSSDSEVQPGAEAKKPNFFQRMFKRTPPRFKGSIDFSEPQEYSRERLISEWLNEYDVYSTVLGTYTTLDSTANTSGAVDERIFDLLAGKLTASFDPLKGRLDKAGGDAEVARINNQNALNEQYVQLQREQLQGQIDQMRQERQILNIKMAHELAALQNSPAATNTTGVTQPGSAPTVPTVSPSAALNAASAKAAAIDASLTAMEGRLNTLMSTANTNGIFSLGGLDANNKQKPMLNKSTVSALPLDQLHDFEAMRNNTIAVRRKRMLDDTHDRMGSNLHHLHFHLTLTPPQSEGRLCKIEARLGEIKYDYDFPSAATLEGDLAKERFINALMTHVRRECQSLDERFGDAFPRNYRTFTNFFASAIANPAGLNADEPQRPTANKSKGESGLRELFNNASANEKKVFQEGMNSVRKLSRNSYDALIQQVAPNLPPAGNPPAPVNPPATGAAARSLIPAGSRDMEDIAALLPGSSKASIEALYLKDRYQDFVKTFCIIRASSDDSAGENTNAIEEARMDAVRAAAAKIKAEKVTAARAAAAKIRDAKAAAALIEAATLEASGAEAAAIKAAEIAARKTQADQVEADKENFSLVTISKNKAGLEAAEAGEGWTSGKNPFSSGQTSSLIKNLAHQFDQLRKDCSVIAVEPSEYAQNISSVAAYERVRSFVGTVTAAFTNGASVGGELQSMLRTQKVMDSILRKPLAVGFIKAGNKNTGETDSFGWYLGPRFEVKEKGGHIPLLSRPKMDVVFSHAEAVYDLEFTMVTPALAREVEVIYRVTWIDPKTGEEDTSLEPRIMRKVMRLTPDYSAFINGILQHREGGPAGPLLSTSSSTEVSTLKTYAVNLVGAAVVNNVPTASSVTAVNVVGSDLWRSPEVYLDGIRADSIKIDSDMRGLRAEFTTLPQCFDGFADLTVVTSTGRDSLIDWVRVYNSDERKTNLPPPRVRSHVLKKDEVDYAALVRSQMPAFVETTESPNVWDYSASGPGNPFPLRVSGDQRPMINGELIPINWTARMVPANIAHFAGVSCGVSPGQPYFKLTPAAALEGLDGFNTGPPIIEVAVKMFASVPEWPKPIEVTESLHPSVIFFRNEDAKKLSYALAAAVPDRADGVMGKLTFPAGADVSLFMRGWGRIGELVKNPANLKLRVKSGDPLPAKVEYSSTAQGASFVIRAVAVPVTPAPAPPAPAEKVFNALPENVELVVSDKVVIPISMPKK